MIEAVKFLATGITNTAVDFAVLNLCIVIFGIAQGDPKYILFKALSYIAASTNSFFLNKWWVFKKKEDASKKEVGSFALISGAGLALNALISLAVFHAGASLYPALSPHVWANIGALTGTALVLFFNFFSYKFLVFKK
jgi:putative flippase GtrA